MYARRSVGLMAFVAFAALLVAGAQPAAAGTSHPSFYGVYYQPQPRQERDIRAMDQGNIQHARTAVRWSTVEPRQGSYNWTEYDQRIGDMAAHGIKVLPVLFGSPHWAEPLGGTSPPLSSDASRQGWSNFVTAAVNRYGPGGTYWTTSYLVQHPGKAPKPITDWQAWNEENLQHYFATDDRGPVTDADKSRRINAYAELLQLTHAAVKRGDSSSSVVLGGLVGNGEPSGSMDAWGFLSRLYHKRGIKNQFEVAAIHPYATTPHYMKKWLRNYREVMKKHHDGGTPVWVTEIGWGSGHPDKYGFNLGPQGQKRMLTKALSVLYQRRNKYGLDRAYWFELRDPEHGNPRCSFCGTSGLLKSNFDKKPAWRAFKRFT
ncbi:MAG: beta-galactosidase [Solirubrobacterales bacterium]